MDKKQFKQVKKQLKAQEKADFLTNLPMEESLFVQLFTFLDEKLQNKDCKHTLENTFVFLNRNKVSKPYQVTEWLEKHGGYCDCEVMYNVTAYFDHLEPTWEAPVEESENFKLRIEPKQKLSGLHTDFGFAIDSVPKPWKLNQSKETGRNFFHFGKTLSGCMANLEEHFPENQWDNDDYFTQNRSDCTIERIDWEHYELVVVQLKNIITTQIYCKPKHTLRWYLEITTERQRYKGDLQELKNLVKHIYFKNETK